MFRTAARNIAAALTYMGQFIRHLRTRNMITKPQPFTLPFSDRRITQGPRPTTTFPGWGPKI